MQKIDTCCFFCMQVTCSIDLSTNTMQHHGVQLFSKAHSQPCMHAHAQRSPTHKHTHTLLQRCGPAHSRAHLHALHPWCDVWQNPTHKYMHTLLQRCGPAHSRAHFHALHPWCDVWQNPTHKYTHTLLQRCGPAHSRAHFHALHPWCDAWQGSGVDHAPAGSASAV